MRKRLIFVAPVPMTLNFFLRLQIEELSKNYDITLISNFKEGEIEIEGVEIIHAPISRSISLFVDLYCLLYLIFLFKRIKPAAVHSIGPKAGLLCSLASWVAGIRNRIHCFTGQVWVDYRGLKRTLFILIDKIIARLCTDVIIDSPTQKDFLIAEGVVGSESLVFGDGSISGVDVNRFSYSEVSRFSLRGELGIPDDKFVFLFLGRVTADKGVQELLEAFKLISRDIGREGMLVVVGPCESEVFSDVLFDMPCVLRIPFTKIPEDFFSASDILCLPSYREGFGQVVVEAAACKLPAIVSRIYGLSDAVVDRETGYLVDRKNVTSLANAMNYAFNSRDEIKILGKSARERVVEKFNSKRIVSCYVNFYKEKI